jgi:hypothetical protein
VATVKLHVLPPGTFLFGGWTAAPKLQISGNRVTTRSSLDGLLAAAYNLKSFQISGAPGGRISGANGSSSTSRPSRKVKAHLRWSRSSRCCRRYWPNGFN